MVFIAYCAFAVMAFGGALFANGFVIMLVTRAYGDRRRFGIALRTSLIEIGILYIINVSVVFTVFWYMVKKHENPEDGFIGLIGFLSQPTIHISTQIINVLLTILVLMFLIKFFYSFKTLTALKAAAIVVGFDILITVIFAGLMYAIIALCV